MTPENYAKIRAIWRGVVKRTRATIASTSHDYPYIAKGIRLDERWVVFENFLRDMGPAYEQHVAIHGMKKTQIDRINNKLGYGPDNCRWATPSLNSRNRSSTRWVEYNGETMPITVLSAKLLGNRTSINTRLSAGWSLDKAINTPLRPRQASTQPYQHHDKDKLSKWEALSAQKFGNPKFIVTRIYRGWDEDRAINEPRHAAGKKPKRAAKS